MRSNLLTFNTIALELVPPNVDRGPQQAIEDEVLQALDADERAALRRLLVQALRGVERTPACADASDLTPA